MPANVVRTSRDERLWGRAKEQAAKQGRAGDWAYVQGIYQRMKGSKSLEKALYVGPRGGRWSDPRHTIPWKADRGERLRITDAVIGVSSGQVNAVLSALSPEGQVVGTLEYAVYQGKPTISMVKTASGKLRAGVATQLVGRLAKGYGYANLDWGMMTDSGYALRDSMDRKYGYDRKKSRVIDAAAVAQKLGGEDITVEPGYERGFQDLYAKFSSKQAPVVSAELKSLGAEAVEVQSVGDVCWISAQIPIHGLEKGLNEPAGVSNSLAFAQHRLGRWPIGHPNFDKERYERAAMRALETPPKPFRASMLLEDTNIPMRPATIVRGLGFDVVKEREWAQYLENATHTAANEVVLRRLLLDRFEDEHLDPERRRLIMQRSRGYYRTLDKSVVEVWTPDQVLAKADPRGGRYYRRVPKKSGKGHTYYYTQGDYDRSGGAHVDGAGALEKRITAEVSRVVESAGKGGCDIGAFGPMAKRYGAKAVGGVLRKTVGRSLAYQGGKFRSMTAPAGEQRAAPSKNGKDEPDKKSGKKENSGKEVQKGHRFMAEVLDG